MDKHVVHVRFDDYQRMRRLLETYHCICIRNNSYLKVCLHFLRDFTPVLPIGFWQWIILVTTAAKVSSLDLSRDYIFYFLFHLVQSFKISIRYKALRIINLNKGSLLHMIPLDKKKTLFYWKWCGKKNWCPLEACMDYFSRIRIGRSFKKDFFVSISIFYFL